MEGTREGVNPRVPEEITRSDSVVRVLREAEGKADARKYIRDLRDIFRNKPPLFMKHAVGIVVEQVENSLNLPGVSDEMLRLGIAVSVGSASVSVKPETDEEEIEYWKKQGQLSFMPPAAVIVLGPAQIVARKPRHSGGGFSWNGGSISGSDKIDNLLNQSESSEEKRKVVEAVQGLVNLSPRDILSAFRRSIEKKDREDKKQLKKEQNYELMALRRGK